jgi:hypothetical protein
MYCGLLLPLGHWVYHRLSRRHHRQWRRLVARVERLVFPQMRL